MQEPPLNAIESPCVRNCCLDPSDVCLGCYRTLNEIVAWSQVDDDEKKAVLERCAQRQLSKE